MKRVGETIREQHAMAFAHVAVIAVLETNGFVPMGDDQWGHGIQMFTTYQALVACEQEDLSVSWLLLVGDQS